MAYSLSKIRVILDLSKPIRILIPRKWQAADVRTKLGIFTVGNRIPAFLKRTFCREKAGPKENKVEERPL